MLALSATPGGDKAAINEVIGNLLISNLETRCEDDEELKKYRHARLEEVIRCNPSEAVTEVDRLLVDMMEPYVKRLKSAGLLYANLDMRSLTPYTVMTMRGDFRGRGALPAGYSEAQVEADFGVLATVAGFADHARNYGHGTLLQVGVCIPLER